jgi:transcriptional regulator with XRE-family HTH domain
MAAGGAGISGAAAGVLGAADGAGEELEGGGVGAGRSLGAALGMLGPSAFSEASPRPLSLATELEAPLQAHRAAPKQTETKQARVLIDVSALSIVARAKASSVDSHNPCGTRARRCANLPDVSLNYEDLARDFIRALRGGRSQAALSRRLGFRTNVLYAWESGRRWPTAAVVLHTAQRLRIDVKGLLRRFFASTPGWLEPLDPAAPAGVARLLEELRGKIPVVELARRTGLSRYAIARWLSGAAQPRFPDFLRLFEGASLRVLDFVALFHEPSTLPSAASAWRALQAHRSAVYEYPWISAVLGVLELSEYSALSRHLPGWIAQRLGISLEEEQRCLEVLSESGQIVRKGRRWELARSQTVDTRQDPSAERKLKEWWAELGVSRLRAGAPGQFSFNVFAVSEADYARLRELHQSYFRQLRSIVAQSTPSERILVANVQLFPLDGPAAPAPVPKP